jgi:hypothetical protein
VVRPGPPQSVVVVHGAVRYRERLGGAEELREGSGIKVDGDTG